MKIVYYNISYYKQGEGIVAKVALSITIDKGIAEKLKFLAKEDKRTVSNFSEVIFSKAIEERMQKGYAEQSLEKAKAMAECFEVLNYREVNDALKKNVSYSPEDLLDF